jgi:hypothetical protein
MNPNIAFILMIIISFAIGTIVTIVLVKFVLFLGIVLKRRMIPRTD